MAAREMARAADGKKGKSIMALFKRKSAAEMAAMHRSAIHAARESANTYRHACAMAMESAAAADAIGDRRAARDARRRCDAAARQCLRAANAATDAGLMPVSQLRAMYRDAAECARIAKKG